MRFVRFRLAVVMALVLVPLGVVNIALAGSTGPAGGNADPFEYWTPERVASAVPRDLVVDHRGLAYLRSAHGGLEPYGHSSYPTASRGQDSN